MIYKAMELPYPDNPGQTHYDDCWASPRHHNCAVRRVAELEAENERLTRVAKECGDVIDQLQNEKDQLHEQLAIARGALRKEE